MAKDKPDKLKSHDFFEENTIDPMAVATGSVRDAAHRAVDSTAAAAKQKAGFYLSRRVLERFNRKFHELKMQGKSIDNKSALLEAALEYALDDIDQGVGSRILAVFDGTPRD